MIFPFYSLIDIVASLIFSFYYVHSKTLKTQKPHLDKIHKTVLLITIIFCCFDAIWGLFDCSVLVNKNMFKLITTITLLFVSIISFFWVIYAIAYLDKVIYRHFFFNITFFCSLLQVALLVTNIFKPVLFYISKDNAYYAGDYRSVFFLLQSIPHITIFFLCLYHIIKEVRTHLLRYLIVILFVLTPFFCGILQRLFPSAPFLTIGYLTALSVTHIFVISQKHDKLIKNQNCELQDVLASITSTFEVIATLNLDTGEESLIRTSGIMKRGAFINRKDIEYKNRIYAFLHDVVYKEDRETVFQEMQPETIWNEVKDGSPHRFKFRVVKDGLFYWFEIRITLLSTQKKSRAVAFIIRDTTTEVLKEQQFTRQLLESKQKMQEQLNILTSIADIYLTMHLIDLKTNVAHSYSSHLTHVEEYINAVKGAKNQMKNVMSNTVKDEYIQKVLEFTDIDTLAQRMNGKKVIYKDFVGKNVGWFRAQFIAIKYDQKGELEQVMFTTQIVDEEKRREENIILMSKTDELTQIANRRSYDEELQKLETCLPENLVVISADLNNLKYTNDTKGHTAGDELICGAATILSDSFKKYGNVFRTGGDEFVAFITTDDFEPLFKDFYDRMNRWHGKSVDSVKISMGYAAKKENPQMDIQQLCQLADSQMYKVKAEFYKKSGIERRRHRIQN